VTTATVPPYLSPGQIGLACGVSRKVALAELRRASLLELRGGRWRISESRLRERLPDYHDRVYAFFVLERQRELPPRGRSVSPEPIPKPDAERRGPRGPDGAEKRTALLHDIRRA
jgi:hypothetical protein